MVARLNAVLKNFLVSTVTLVYSLFLNAWQIGVLSKLFSIFGIKNKVFIASLSLAIAALLSSTIVELIIFLVDFYTPKVKHALRVPVATLTFQQEEESIDEIIFSITNDLQGCENGKTIDYTFDILPKGKIVFFLLKLLRANLIVKFNPQILQIGDAGSFDQEQKIIDGRKIQIPLIDGLEYKNDNESFTKSLNIVPTIRYTKNSDILIMIRCGIKFIKWLPVGFLVKFSSDSLRVLIKK